MARGQLCGVVALDGPSGTGKSTVARRLATVLDTGYLDTGAMYRAVTLAVLRSGAPLDDVAAVTLAAAECRLRIGTDPARPGVELDGENVTADIRGEPVTAAVSAVSAVADIRDLLVAEQRRIIEAAVSGGGGLIVEGRDIGTVVAPDAALKVYLTATSDARAARRSRQDVAAGRTTTVHGTHADVRRRDHADSTRATSPLRAAEDSVHLDTTRLDARGVVARILAMVKERGMRRVPDGSGI
jgi:cytidylate kinase